MPSARIGPISILLVDDSVCHLQTTGFALRRAGYLVREASHAQAAQADLDRNGPPGVCVIDHIMADTDGVQLIQQLHKRRDTRRVPMVLMSTAPAQHIRELALKADAQAWLAKPFAPEQLLAILSIVLSR